ncbi:MAG TPA: hypothetical protein VL426_04130 [Candidatus Binatia bacterium]|jgi:hypothetical protein|nr:hypothetical protein [Candidatus Binatia bacterium]
MPVSRDALYDFLVANTPRPALVPEAMERLAPYFAQAEADQFVLCPAAELDHAEAVEAISRAVKRPVTGIVTVSLAEPVARPPWMGTRQYDLFVSETLLSSYRDLLAPALDERVEKLKMTLGIPCWRAFIEHLGESLWTSLENCVPDSLKVPLSLHHGMALWHRLFLYVASAATADAATMAEVGPLVSLCAKALPLGEKLDEKGTWLVLVA